MKPNLRRTRSLAIILSTVALAAIPARSLAEVPPEAQPAFSKGVLAAQQQEWDIALQSFQDARKIAPTAPEIYYNLGLTESKIPGRELRAIAWLAAYLAADPAAPNAAAVKTAILGQLVKNEGNIDRFIEVTRKAAEQVPEGDMGVGTEVALSEVFRLYAETGDEAKAASFASEAHLNEVHLTANSALSSMTEFGGRDGIERARILAPSQEPSVRSWIAMGEAKIGDIAGALKDISMIPDGDDHKPYALIAVARAQFELGQKQASWATLQDARVAVQKMKNVSPFVINNYYSPICYAQVSVGDLAGARTTADGMAIEQASDKDSCLEEIGMSQLSIGDVQAAQSTTNHIENGGTRGEVQDEVDRYNKDPAARKVVLAAKRSLSTDDWINDVGSGNGNKRISGTSANDWVNELDDDRGLSAPPFLDLSGYVTSVTGPKVYQPERLLYSTARWLLSERRFVTEMLAKQFGPSFVP